MKILWDEGVDARYQKEFQRQSPENWVFDRAQKVGLGGSDASMKGLDEQKRDEKVGSVAAERKYDAIITTDQGFLSHLSADRVPLNVMRLDPGKDRNGNAIHPTVENLRQFTPELTTELSSIERGQNQKPQIRVLTPEPHEQAQQVKSNLRPSPTTEQNYSMPDRRGAGQEDPANAPTQKASERLETQRIEAQREANRFKTARDTEQKEANALEKQHVETQQKAEALKTQQSEAQQKADTLKAESEKTQRAEVQEKADRLETQHKDAQQRADHLRAAQLEAQARAQLLEQQRSEAQQKADDRKAERDQARQVEAEQEKARQQENQDDGPDEDPNKAKFMAAAGIAADVAQAMRQFEQDMQQERAAKTQRGEESRPETSSNQPERVVIDGAGLRQESEKNPEATRPYRQLMDQGQIEALMESNERAANLLHGHEGLRDVAERSQEVSAPEKGRFHCDDKNHEQNVNIALQEKASHVLTPDKAFQATAQEKNEQGKTIAEAAGQRFAVMSAENYAREQQVAQTPPQAAPVTPPPQAEQEQGQAQTRTRY